MDKKPKHFILETNNWAKALKYIEAQKNKKTCAKQCITTQNNDDNYDDHDDDGAPKSTILHGVGANLIQHNKHLQILNIQKHVYNLSQKHHLVKV